MKSFVCIYCNKAHPLDASACPETGAPLSPAHKLAYTNVDEKYAINGVVGEGGMGVIYEAEDMESGRVLAIKFLNPAACQSKQSYQRFVREARAAAMIGHPNLVQVFDIGTSGHGIAYIAMERLDGEDLGDRIEATETFPMEGTVEILGQVLRTLEAVHAKGIVHRDLKPENIFIVKDEELGEHVKLLDFGVARLSTTEQGEARLTTSGRIFGTPYYAAPEQAAGELNVDHRADLYSVGAMFHEMLTGQLPFFAKSLGRVLLKIMTEPPPDPRTCLVDLPGSVADFVSTALAKNPNRRFQSAREMLEELRSLDLAEAGWVIRPRGRIKPQLGAGSGDLETPPEQMAEEVARILDAPGGRSDRHPPDTKVTAGKTASSGGYKIITPYAGAARKERDADGLCDEETRKRFEENLLGELPPQPRGDASRFKATAAKKQKAGTIPKPKPRVPDALAKGPMTTPTPDRDEEDET